MIFPAIKLHLDVPASRVWLPKGNQVLPKVLKAKDTHSKGSRDQLLHKNLFEENLPRTLFSKQVCWENVNCPSMDTGLSGSNAFVCKRLALNRRLTETRPTLRRIVGKYSVQTVTKSSAIPRSKIVLFIHLNTNFGNFIPIIPSLSIFGDGRYVTVIVTYFLPHPPWCDCALVPSGPPFLSQKRSE